MSVRTSLEFEYRFEFAVIGNVVEDATNAQREKRRTRKNFRN